MQKSQAWYAYHAFPPQLLSFDWLELSSPVCSCRSWDPPRYSLNWRCFASSSPPCRLHQLFLRPTHYCCLKHFAVHFNLLHAHCGACFMPSWLQPGIRGERPASSYGSCQQKKEETMLISDPLCSPCLTELLVQQSLAQSSFISIKWPLTLCV